jgi:photosystem II stability/assembly factor-like uncharacterized protein
MNSAAVAFILVTPWIAAAVGMPAGQGIGPTPDVLERPALFSARASDSVLLAVTRANQRLLAVGERGIVLFSDDGATSWQQARVPISATLTAIQFVTEKKGWAVGHSGAVLRTEDGGAHWVKQLDGNQAAQLMLEDAQKNAMEHDDDQARRRLSEAQRLLREGPDKPFFDIWFVDEKRGFIVGAFGLFFATQDGGKTWLPWRAHIENPTDKHLYCIRSLGGSLYLVGEEGALYRSTDAGRTFIGINTPYRGSWFGVIPLEKQYVIAYGLRGNAYWSQDAGQHWRKIDTGTQAALTAGMVLSDGSVVLASQAGEVLRSIDFGRSFKALAVARPFPFSGVAQAANGDLVLSGARGISRVSIRQAIP